MTQAPGSAPRDVVAINGRAAVREEIGGVERLAREMAYRLPQLRPERYRVLAPPPRLAHRLGHAWEQVALPLRAAGCGLIYSPANLAPAGSRRNVIVIHDVAALRHPEAYSGPYVAYQRVMLPLLARRARLVITVSEFARRELVEVLGLQPETVAVIPPGVAESFGPGVDPRPAARAYGLERPYVLAVGTVSARKNLGALELTERKLREQGLELVVAGSERGYLRSARIELRRLGYVPEALLPSLYAGARVVVMPSHYEGFGLPCLEAMACGVPVVYAPRCALPEVCGEGGLPADPADQTGFAEAVLRAVSEEPLRSRLAAAGPPRAAQYSWGRTAELTDRALGALLEGS